MDLRVPALQKWSKISPANAASTDTDIVRTWCSVSNDVLSWFRGCLHRVVDDVDADDDDDNAYAVVDNADADDLVTSETGRALLVLSSLFTT